MRRPSARVGLNRRRTFAYLPLLIIGALLFTLAFPVLNGVAVSFQRLVLPRRPIPNPSKPPSR